MKKLAISLLLVGLTSVSMAQSSNFGGYYWGAQVGVGENSTRISDHDWWYAGTQNDSNRSVRPLLGLKFGYDVVAGSQIYGYLVEGSLSSLNSQKEVNPQYPMYRAGSKITALGSVRGKYGVVSDKLAVFGTAGVAFANIKHKYNETDGSGEQFNAKGKKLGYVFGLGTSYALTNSTAIGVDVSRYSFGSKTHDLLESDGTPTGSTYGMKDRVDVINVSYTVKF